MKKVALLLAIMLVICIPVNSYAASRMLLIVPELTFVGTKAVCKVTVYGNNESEHIVATMRLYHGTNCLVTWVVEGDGVVDATKSYPVSAGQTYKLVVDVTINGVAMGSDFTTGTCLLPGSME